MGLEAQGIRRRLSAADRRGLYRAHAEDCPAGRHNRMSPRRSDARQRMLDSTTTLIRQRGASATSLDDILAHSKAPRGSIYYHFPGGRTQLIEEAVEHAGASIEQLLADAGDLTPVEVFDGFVSAWRDGIVASSFLSGCPVLAVAIESNEDTPQLTAAAARAFASWRG